MAKDETDTGKRIDGPVRRLGYIRTSTDRQSPARQIDGLRSVCDEVFIEEGVSASSAPRPVYDGLIATLEPGDVLVVWDVDRAYRSVIDALTEVKRLNARGIQFEAMSGEYDLSTPDGGFTFTLRAALSEWEREKLRARTREGLAAARARGVTLGRPRKLSRQKIEKARRALKRGGTTIKQLAQELKVAPRTLSRALKK
ncbi:MAG: hypothetical protein CME84_05870 [Henriciella sp.]|nr:hypothetical protein [Henriciella sp.]|tara:strand:- start:11780 stop:12376 length:597 start_codon:yes stop_codon:yes gene_type:complete